MMIKCQISCCIGLEYMVRRTIPYLGPAAPHPFHHLRLPRLAPPERTALWTSTDTVTFPHISTKTHTEFTVVNEVAIKDKHTCGSFHAHYIHIVDHQSNMSPSTIHHLPVYPSYRTGSGYLNHQEQQVIVLPPTSPSLKLTGSWPVQRPLVPRHCCDACHRLLLEQSSHWSSRPMPAQGHWCWC